MMNANTHYALGWYRDLDGYVQEMRGEIDPVTGVVRFPHVPTCGMMLIPYPENDDANQGDA